MKRAAQLLLFPVLILFLTGCGTSKSTALSQEEVQSITTRTYDENYDLVYKSILSAIADGKLRGGAEAVNEKRLISSLEKILYERGKK